MQKVVVVLAAALLLEEFVGERRSLARIGIHVPELSHEPRVALLFELSRAAAIAAFWAAFGQSYSFNVGTVFGTLSGVRRFVEADVEADVEELSGRHSLVSTCV